MHRREVGSVEFFVDGRQHVVDLRLLDSLRHRQNPFEFPIDLLGEQTSDPVKTVGQISVMGFADVGRPTVMLKTPRDVYSLGIGESVDGITVIAINPPAVDLQLGTLNWTAHLFDAR